MEMNIHDASIIQRGCYVNKLPDLYIKDDLEGVLIIDKDYNNHYELAIDTPCDRSDLAGLNINLQKNDLHFIMKINEDTLSFTHLVKDSDGFIFAVEIKKED